jgi:Thioredoxin like C-terminal domain
MEFEPAATTKAGCDHRRSPGASGAGPVARPAVRFTVRLDGEPSGRARGIDIDEDDDGVADYQRVYPPIRQLAPIGDRLFEVEFLDAGLEAFVFTLG